MDTVTPDRLPTVRSTLRTSLTVLAVATGAWLLYLSRGAVAAMVAAALVSVALLHGVDALVRRGMKRSRANAVVLVAFLAVIVGLAVVLVPKVVSQAAELIQRGPELLQQIRHSPVVERIESRYHVQEKLEQSESGTSLSQVMPSAVAAVGGALGVLVRLVMVLFLTVFMVLFGSEVVRAAVKEARPEWRERYERVLTSVYASVGGYLGGLALICSINATLTTTFLGITGEPYFLALGVLSGFSSLVPYAGPFVVHTSITVFAFASGGVWHGVATAAYFLVYDNLEGNVLGPLVFRRTVHVNPLVSLSSVLILGEFAGVIGALVAVPAAAAAQIILREYFAARRGEPPSTLA